MDRTKYKEFHEKFVSNHDGTTLWEISLVSLVAPFSVLIVSKLDNWLGNSRSVLRFLCEYMILALPLLIVLTEVTNSFDAVFTLGVVTIFFNAINTTSVKQTNDKKLCYLTNYRASMLLVTAICILGVDFQVFPRRFAKTETLGFGLMDIGVGSFIFSAGVVSPTTNEKIWHNIKKSIPLFVLGTMKYFLTKMVDYPSHVSEYGIHWNFFITFAIIQLFCGSLTCKIGARRKLLALFATMICLGYEYWLQSSGTYQWIFNFNDSHCVDCRLKSGFFVANAEGIVSLLGYSGLFLIGASLKGIIYGLNRRSSWKIASACTLILWAIFVFSVNEGHLILSSRRLCNLSYIIWMVAYNLTIILLYAGIEVFTGATKNPWMYDTIARRAMYFFLLANLLTGLVNMVVQPSVMSDTPWKYLSLDNYSRCILAIYVLILFSLGAIWDKFM